MKKACKLLLMSCTMLILFQHNFAYSQTTNQIAGTITDDKGVVLQGATVKVKGTKASTVSDANGKYFLNIPATAKTLVVSYVGMKDEEIFINGKSILDITVTPSSNSLNDVVVIGYGTTKRAYVSSAISSVNEKDIKNIPQAGVDQMLQGKVPGVTIDNNSGTPGGGVSVHVRGITSVYGDNQPLYVIDGNPVPLATTSTNQNQLGGIGGQTTQSPLATLNPNDIVSIDILKDASAQAIYGASGGNGVILITTKHGKSGEGKLSYNVYYGTNDVPKKLPLMNLQQYAQYYNSVVADMKYYQSIDGDVPTIDSIGEFKDPSVLGKGTSWQDAVFQTGNTQNHQLSFSGGQGKTTYYFSGNYYDQTGTVIGSGFKRYAATFNLDQQVKSWLKAGISGNLSRSEQKITLTDGQQSVMSIMLYNSPATPVKDFNGNYINTTTISGVPFGNTQNPVALALLRDVRSIQSKAYGNAYVDIQITKDLDFKNQLNYSFQNNENIAFEPNISENGQLIVGPSRYRLETDINNYYGLQSYLSYNHSFDKHSLNVLAGHEVSYYNYDNAWQSVTNLTQNIESLAAGTVDPAQTNGNKGDGATESFFGRIIYSYDNRYSVTASARRDGSSNFGPGRRWGNFPAVSGAWTITNENFAKNWKKLNSLKLRVGYGEIGVSSTQGSSLYTTNIRLIPTITGLFGSTTVAGVPANIGNPDLAWQTVTTYNVGVDASILNKRVSFSVDAYRKVTTGMILNTILPSFAGLDPNPPGNSYQDIEPPVINGGKMTNTGIEFNISSQNIETKNFTWNTSVVFTHYKNVLNYLNAPGVSYAGKSQDFTPVTLTLTQAGNAVGSFYGFVTEGLYRTMEELSGGPSPMLPVGVTGTWLGDIRYADLNNDKMITSADQTFLGDPNPKFTYSLTNTFSYKGIDLSIFLNGVYGNKIFNYSRLLDESLFNAYENQLTTVLDRFTNTNPNGALPRYDQFNNNNLKVSDRYIESGSYLRIQNVSLGYNLPQKIISKIKMSNVRIYVSGQNLYTFTKYSGYDPDLGQFNNSVFTANIDYGHYPNPRSITFGANIDF